MAKTMFQTLPLAEADLLIWSFYSGRLDNDVQFVEDLVNLGVKS